MSNNTVGHSLLAEIDTMELCDSNGTKIDTEVSGSESRKHCYIVHDSNFKRLVAIT